MLLAVFGGQERRTDGVASGRRQVKVHHRAEELVGNLGEQAGAVAGTLVSSYCPAVFEVAQGGEGGVDNFVGGLAAQGGDHGQAAGVLFIAGPVEAGVLRKRGKALEGRDYRETGVGKSRQGISHEK